MNAYPQVPLGEICTINPRSARAADSDDTVVSFVPMAAINEVRGAISIREDRPLAGLSKGYTTFEEGDVLFAKITPCMENGKAALARNLTNGIGRGSTEFYVLRPSDQVLGEYIYYFVRQPNFREEARRNFTGTAGQQRVPKQFMENSAPWKGAAPLRVRIPPGNCRSSRKQSERVMEATTWPEALRWNRSPWAT